MRITRKRMAALALAVMLGMTTACGAQNGGNSNPPAVEQVEEAEDCDADDVLERDEDCGFSKKKSSTKKPTTTQKKSSTSGGSKSGSRSSTSGGSRSSTGGSRRK